MLIDSSHKIWIGNTLLLGVLALGGYFWADWQSAGQLTGGQGLRLWYAVVGSLLMIFAGLLSALRKVPSWWWIGSRQSWLRGHIWLGLLSGVFILCHGGFRWGGWLERLLWIVLSATLLTGIAGLLIQQVLPRMMTIRLSREAPYEQIPHLRRLLRAKADQVLRDVSGTAVSESQADLRGTQLGLGARVQLQTFAEKHVLPFLDEGSPWGLELADPLRAESAFSRLRLLPGLKDVSEQISELESLCDERRQLAQQERLHMWLHGWLLVHIPLSVALLVLGVFHAVVSLYY